MGINTDAVQRLYVAYFNRPADPVGLAFWEGKLPATAATQAQLEALASGFSGSQEYADLYAGMTNAAIVDTLYTNLFGRSAEPAGLIYWAGKLTDGTETFASIALQLTFSAQGTDATAISNKLAASTTFTTALDTTAEIVGYSGTSAANVARAWLALVDDTAASLTTANSTAAATVVAAVAAGEATSGAGQNFVLTTAVDIKAGTAGNDTIIGDNSGAAATQTMSVGDQVDGAGGTDTFVAYNAAATAFGAFVLPTMTNVEVLQFVGGALTGTPSVDATSLGGGTLTSVELKDMEDLASNAVFSITASGQTVAITNLTSTSGVYEINLNSATDLVLSGVTAVGAAGATLDLVSTDTTLNINADGTSKVTLANTGAALSKLVVTGDSKLTVSTAALTSVKTIDGSANTKAVVADVSGATQNIAFAFTGGSGSDKLTVAAGQLASTALTSGAQIAFGAGGTDTLVVKDTAMQYTTINAMTGLEVLAMGANGAAVDMSLLTPHIVALSAGTQTISNLASDDIMVFNSGTTGADKYTIGGAVGNSTATIAVGADATNVGMTVEQVNVSGLTDVKLISQGAGTGANILTAITNSDNTKFTVTGSNDLTMAVLVAATVTGDKIDASAFTGKLNATGSNLADIIIGGTAADTLDGGKGADTLTGGSGVDNFCYGGTAGATLTGTANADGLFDSITDFTVGSDKINFTGVTAVVSTQQAAVQAAVTALAAGSTAAQIETAMAATNTTNLGVSFAVYNGDTYMYFETTGATATDVAADNIFVKLVGLTTAPTFAADVTP